jgi:GT2 family glycosyltransferase
MASTSLSNIAAVVVTYNAAPWLVECLDSLNGSMTPISMIFVVDNASTDQTVSIARNTRNVTLIETGENLGFGRANNIGIAKALDADAEYVFLLNQDAHVAPDAVTKLLFEAHEHPELGILCPMQLDGTGRAFDQIFLTGYLAPNAPELVYDAFLGHVGNCYKVSAAPAAAWLLSRKFLVTVGGFDPLFFMYAEDDDLCRRAQHHGFGIAIVPHAKVYHYRGFHGTVTSVSNSQKLARRASRVRARLVYDIKSPFGKFPNNVWHAIVSRLFDGLNDIFNDFDWVGALAYFTATAKVVTELPRITRHRATCLRIGPHWLPLDQKNRGGPA